MTTPQADLGFWTGSIDYTPSAANLGQLTPVSIPLGAVDGNGTAWLITKLTGWDSPDVQGGGVIAKSGDHGAFAAPQFYAARALTLSVQATALTQALRDVARAQLQQAVPVSDLAVFTYDEPVPKQVMVRRSGQIPETYPTLFDVVFSIVLIAPDPRKYSVEAYSPQVNAVDTVLVGAQVPFTVPVTLPPQPSDSGAISAQNHGTFESPPVITITGPVTAPAVTNVTTGQTVSWSALTLGADDVLVADFSVQETQLNGVFVPADLFSSWWMLPPGVSTIQMTGSAQPGSGMTLSYRDAWI